MLRKEILETIANIEGRFDVNSVVYGELKIWPLVRLAISQQLYNSTSMKNIANNGRVPVIVVPEEQKALLRSFQGTEFLFLTDSKVGEYVEQIEGKCFTPFTDPMVDFIKDRHICLKLEVLEHDIEGTLPRYQPTVFIEPKKVRSEQDAIRSISNFSGLREAVNDFSGVEINEAVFLKQARTIKAYHEFYKEILSIVLPKVVFCVCYYYHMPMALISACKEMGIKTVDIQHGCYADYDCSYTHLTKIPPDGYKVLPDYFWCWGEVTKVCIERFNTPGSVHKPVVGGNPRLAHWLGREKGLPDKKTQDFYELLKTKEKVILVPISNPVDGLPEHLLEAMNQGPDSWLWLIRLHPYEPMRNKEVRRKFVSMFEQHNIDNYEMELASDSPLFELLQRCDHNVMVSGSVFCEGYFFEVATTLIDPSKYDIFKSYIESNQIFCADTVEALLNSIERGFSDLEVRSSEHIEVSRDSFESAMKEILGPDYKEISGHSVELLDVNAPDLNNGNSKVDCKQQIDKYTPKIFAVETVLGCDLKCPECAIGGDMISRKKGMMSFQEFKIIADKIRPYCKHLYPHIWGEPMLNKDIFKMIEYASSFTKVNISTNGKCMTRQMAKELILSGVTDIIVSIDGITQEVYEHYRQGGSVTKALWALSVLNEFNRKNGNKVKISPQFIVFKHNQHQMRAFESFCNSLGLQPSFKSPYIRSDSKYDNSDLSGYTRPFYQNVDLQREAMAQNCASPKDTFTILLDGTCVACCHDHNSETNYGNMFKQDVMEIWNSPAYRKDREAIMTGNAPDSCLKTCLNWTCDRNVCGDKSKDRILEMV